MADGDRSEVLSRHRLLARLLLGMLVQLDGGRPGLAAPGAVGRRRVHPALSRADRHSTPHRAGGCGTGAGVGRRPAGHQPVGSVAVVPQRFDRRRDRPPVRLRPWLLLLHPAVPGVRTHLAVCSLDHDRVGHRRRVLPQRLAAPPWRPKGRVWNACGQGAPVGAVGGARPGESRRILLRGAAFAHLRRGPGLRWRRIHRDQRPVAGHAAAHDGVAVLRWPLHRQREASWLGVARGGPLAVVGGRGARRRRSTRLRAALSGRSPEGRTGDRLHQTQPVSHRSGLRARHAEDGRFRLHRERHRGRC